ncbi:thioredoxin family protein [Polaribacter sp. MSW13]|uniref:Thioredoxin family protein n=1 Tax=Polaribacter marinus TaxID=2916838 RepID=A0A9X2AKW5_9FLAO|nr:thioredoxin family protein [Polaribacter marinus]MCI2228645.1 thioredoxin family protein [Polaribacter marinus]
MKKVFYIIVLFGCFATQSQTKKESLKVYSFKDVEELHQQNPKPMVVFIYTDWCKYCFAMEKTTFNNKDVIKALNDKFYFVKLNAKEKKDILFLNKQFKYKPTGSNTGIHQLAKELALKKGRISYPTTTILNLELQIELQITRYMKSKKLIQILSKI